MVGGEGHGKIKMWVRDVLRNGLVRAAQSTGKNLEIPAGSSMEMFIQRNIFITICKNCYIDIYIY